MVHLAHQCSVFCGQAFCMGGCGPTVSGPGMDCMRTAFQNTKDQVTRLVNIALAYDLCG